MRIRASLSPEGLKSVANQLLQHAEDIEHDFSQAIEMLTSEGANVAQGSYGDWGVQVVPLTDGTTGTISVSGDVPVIAEFGAGDATSGVDFENAPNTPVYPGAYSEEHAKQYSTYGRWFFAGKMFTEVPPHHGLLNAKNYVIENASQVIREVMNYD